MSMYNMLFGKCPFATEFLRMLNLTEEDCGRFRDCYLNKEGDRIIIHTRNGGGNREYHQHIFDKLAKHPNYLENSDDSFDCTYADIEFSVPKEFEGICKLLAAQEGVSTQAREKWEVLLNALHEGKETVETQKALQVGRAIFESIQQPLGTSVIKSETGSITVQKVKKP